MKEAPDITRPYRHLEKDSNSIYYTVNSSLRRLRRTIYCICQRCPCPPSKPVELPASIYRDFIMGLKPVTLYGHGTIHAASSHDD